MKAAHDLAARRGYRYLEATAVARQIKLQFTTEGLALSDHGARKRTRRPFSDGWIRDRLLKAGALDGLNADARHILPGMINTGARPS